MFTGITSHGGALVAAIVLLTGGAILRGGAAAADSSQDDQFRALLNVEGIPAVQGMPTLIDTAHKVCLVLDRGISVDTMIGAMLDNAYAQDPAERQYPRGRLVRTMTRFITASVEAYCPNDQPKIASIWTNPVSASNGPALPGAAWRDATGSGVLRLRSVDDRSSSEALGAVLASSIGAPPSGEMVPSPPPDIPPPPPVEHLRTPPRPVAVQPAPKRLPPLPKRPPPPPKRPPPPPQQPPPPPQQPPPPPPQVKPPAAAPQPGGAAEGGGGIGGGGTGTGGPGGGIGGGGSSGGGAGGHGGRGPVHPAPAPAGPPGFVRLAP